MCLAAGIIFLYFQTDKYVMSETADIIFPIFPNRATYHVLISGYIP